VFLFVNDRVGIFALAFLRGIVVVVVLWLLGRTLATGTLLLRAASSFGTLDAVLGVVLLSLPLHENDNACT
jgi:hypothetical protein